MIKTSLVFYLNEIGSRSNLEDAIYPPPGQADGSSRLFLVCDGVGGLSKGEEASRIVSTTLGKALTGKNEISEQDILNTLLKAQDEMRNYISAHPEASNMSTTLTLAALRQEDILIAWSGDSRVMHIRDGNVIYQTDDHSMVRHLVQSGQITEEEAATHPKRNIILRAVNADTDPDDPEFKTLKDIRNGDWLLLCTDGVLENLNPKEIKSILADQTKGESQIRKAFDELCANKTNDNYSLYLIRLAVSDRDQTTPIPQRSPTTPEQKEKTPNHILRFMLGFVGIALVGFLIWHFKGGSPKEASAPIRVAKAKANSDAGFPGGNKAWLLYCRSEIHYPKSALKKRIQGWAAVRFKVDSSGVPSEFERLSHLNHGMEKELERVISEAKWIPAKENDIPVKDTLTIGWQYVLPDSIGGGIKPF